MGVYMLAHTRPGEGGYMCQQGDDCACLPYIAGMFLRVHATYARWLICSIWVTRAWTSDSWVYETTSIPTRVSRSSYYLLSWVCVCNDAHYASQTALSSAHILILLRSYTVDYISTIPPDMKFTEIV